MPDKPILLLTHTVSPERTAALRPKLDAVLPDGAVRNAETPAETREQLPDAAILVTGRVDEEWFEDADRLRLVQALSAGVDFLPLDPEQTRTVAGHRREKLRCRGVGRSGVSSTGSSDR